MRVGLGFWLVLVLTSTVSDFWFGLEILSDGRRHQFAFAQEEENPRPQIEICLRNAKAHGYSDQFCGLKWGIFQTSRVPEFWVVHEVEFYWDRHCQAKFPVGLPKSSKSNKARALKDHFNSHAWDDDESTSWVSECNVLLGGCKPWDHYIGLQIPADEDPVILNSMQTYATLGCIRLLQSDHGTRYSKSVATVVWGNDTKSGYDVLEEYHDLSYGYWNTRPAMEAALWRIWNGDATSRPWEIGEILFYSDLFCVREVRGVPISLDAFGVPQSDDETSHCYDKDVGCPSIPGCPCDEFVPTEAFNGVRLPGHPLPVALPGFWRAACNPYSGCEAQQAWLGIDLNENPKAVNCIRLYQPTHVGWPDYGFPMSTPRILLQGWSGFEWLTINYFEGLGHGNYSDTRPKDGMAWRLNNFDRMRGRWEVFEMALYEEENCGAVSAYVGDGGVRASGLAGIPIDSNPALVFSEQELECRKLKGSCSKLAFDERLHTAWASACQNCDQRETWIGLMSRKKAWNIRCFRIYQSSERAHQTDAIELSKWDGEKWVIERYEGGVGGGTWNYRPTGYGTGWRLLGSSETAEPWQVSDLKMYADGECSSDPVEAVTIAAGHEATFPSANAMDFDPDGLTDWKVSCSAPRPGSQGCAKGSAWIGLQSPLDSFVVRCLRMNQHRLRSKQMSSAVMEFFDGIRWARVDDFPPLLGLGGGSWQTLPGHQASAWRLVARPIEGGYGVGISELGLYRTPDCSGSRIVPNFPNVATVGSGHGTGREIATKTGYSAHLTFMGDSDPAKPSLAFDGDYKTFWCDIDQISEGPTSPGWTGWIGMDMTSQVTDIMCVRFAFAPVKKLQPAWAELQGWDGELWTTKAAFNAKPTLVIPVPFASSTGWQQRPILQKSMWRVENTMPQVSWEIVELQYYGRIDCGANLQKPFYSIASAQNAKPGVADGGHFLAMNGFDDDLKTRWKADCPDSGCLPGEAWLGGGFYSPTDVRCLRIYQSGRYDMQARTMTLSMWTGEKWEQKAKYGGLGGNSWNMRPAAPDTLWRLTYLGRAEEKCTTLPTRPSYHRNWGVSEFHMYADDDCSVELKGEAIASGSWEDTAHPSVVDEDLLKYYLPAKAVDKDQDTFWAAGCKASWENKRGTCDPGEEWIGLDVGQVNGGYPVEVKCVKIHQSRSLQRMCCDPASELRLDRWNGSNWTEATWRHLPELTHQPPVSIDGHFKHTGECPRLVDKVTGKLDGPNPGVWETRNRRQSDNCEIPLAGSIKLLTDKLCAKHSLCVQGGFATVMSGCCPMASEIMSKCCCDIPAWKIFEDEWVLDINRQPLEPFPTIGVELVVIRIINVMPWFGIILTLLVYILAQIKRPRMNSFKYRLWNAMIGPLHRWLQTPSLLATFLRFFMNRSKNEKITTSMLKRVCLVVFGFLIGGSAIWIACALMIAQVLVRVMMLISYVIKMARSPYDPKEPAERKRLKIALAIPFNADAKALKIPDGAKLLAGFVTALAQTVISFVRAVADIILLRFAMMNMGVVDLNVGVPDILARVPTIALNMQWLTDKVYYLLSLASEVFSEMFTNLFAGVPRCEGPVLTFSGMWLVAITVILVRFLNYDYFGLLVSVKQTVLKTRPMFQKAVSVSVVLVFQSAMFMFMQCVMLLFSRALGLLFGVNMLPTEPSEGWNCPYEGEAMSIFVGRIFLIAMGFFALALTFLSANGHLIGKKQIVGDFGAKCGLDLDELDPQRFSTNLTDLFRKKHFFCMFPSSIGIWFDWWNVDGFMIEERARIYASQLGYPEECSSCGTMHIPYPDVMKATAMQISLAWQLFPFVGPLIGKLAEHANNPPLFYKGTKLKCFWACPSLKAANADKERKMSFGQKVKHYSAVGIAGLKDCALPILQRFVGVGMYFTIVYFTYAINKENLERMGLRMFQLVMVLASLIGYLESFFPLLVLLLLGVALFFAKKGLTKGAELGKKKFQSTANNLSEKEWAKPSLLPLFTLIIQGSSLGGALALYFQRKHQDVNTDQIVLFGSAIGIVSGFLLIAIAYLFEALNVTRMMANFFIWAYCIAVAMVVAFYGSSTWNRISKAVVAVAIGILLLYVTSVSLKPPEFDLHSGSTAPSAIRPVIFSCRAMAGFFGVYAGVFVTVMPFEFWVQMLGSYMGFLVAMSTGCAGGMLYGFATHTICNTKAGKYGMAVGTLVTVMFGMAFHWFVGAMLGSVAATLIGTYFEKRNMDKVKTMSLEPPRYTKSKVMSSMALARYGNPENWRDVNEPEGSAHWQPLDAVAKEIGPPTIVRAESPTKSTIEGGLPLEPLPAESQLCVLDESKREKKHAISKKMGKVVSQGTPGYVEGQSRWMGPPQEVTDYAEQLSNVTGSRPETRDVLSLPGSPPARQFQTKQDAKEKLAEVHRAQRKGQARSDSMDIRAPDESGKDKRKKTAGDPSNPTSAGEVVASSLESAGFAIARMGADVIM